MKTLSNNNLEIFFYSKMINLPPLDVDNDFSMKGDFFKNTRLYEPNYNCIRSKQPHILQLSLEKAKYHYSSRYLPSNLLVKKEIDKNSQSFDYDLHNNKRNLIKLFTPYDKRKKNSQSIFLELSRNSKGSKNNSTEISRSNSQTSNSSYKSIKQKEFNAKKNTKYGDMIDEYFSNGKKSSNPIKTENKPKSPERRNKFVVNTRVLKKKEDDDEYLFNFLKKRRNE